MRQKTTNGTTLAALAGLYASEYAGSSPDGRKAKGQFFTPPEVSDFMAGLFSLPRTAAPEIALLDPGAGAGILTAGFCDVLLKKTYKQLSLHIDLYEKDQDVLPFLKKTLAACQWRFRQRGWKLTFRLYNADFILSNIGAAQSAPRARGGSCGRYDYVISNPPYFKLNADSPENILLREYTSGQPNIYVFFMLVSLLLLKPKGELVFITPRSFCSGLHHMRFRKWLIENYSISHLHLFDSRKRVFYNEDVLQESVILKAVNSKPFSIGQKVSISRSHDASFSDFTVNTFQYGEIFHHSDAFIRIPLTKKELAVGRLLQKWALTLPELGLSVSTGPVIAFRAREYLRTSPAKKDDVIPLLWMHNIQGLDVRWPLDRPGKEKYILSAARPRSILLPARNYILLKRFTSKEQQRRLYAGVLLASNIKSEYIGLENHLNYIHRRNGDIAVDEAFGIAAFLNTSIVDSFFRSINGNTQVNAGDLRALPLPPLAKLKEIGRRVRMQKCLPGKALDSLVARILNIPSEMLALEDENEEDKTGCPDTQRPGLAACPAK